MASDRATDVETLAALDNVGSIHEPVTTREVADALGCSRRAAYNKLEELHDRDVIHTKNVGAQVRVWWRPADSSTGHPGSADTEQKYRTLLESINEGFCTIEMLFDDEGNPVDYRFLETNPAFEEQTGLVDVEGERMRDLEPTHEQYWFDRYGEVAQTGEPVAFEAEANALDRWFDLYAFPFGGHESQQVAVLFGDITERKQAEEKLQESREQFRALVTASSDVVYRMSSDWSEMHELEGKEFLADTDEPTSNWLDKYIHPDEQTRVMEAIDEAVRTKSMFKLEHRVEQNDGSTGWTFSRAVPMLDEDGDIEEWIGMASDITERKQRNRELNRALDLLEKTERIADVGGWEINPDTRDVFWTDHIFDLLEVPGNEEPPLEEALAMYHEDDQPIVEDVVENALNSGEPFDVEVRIRTINGEVRWLRLQGVPDITDGDIVSFRGAVQDVTERKERERKLEELVEQLEESNERLESLSSMIAHELRNPVTIGQIYSQQLPTEAAPDAVDYVVEAFGRIENMVDVLLLLSHGRTSVDERNPVSLADAVQGAWDEVDAPDAMLQFEINDEIRGDETYIQHLFRNLFENAVLHGGSDVTVQVQRMSNGFFVADDGCGVAVEDQETVFEAGFTTAAGEGGTGLGLAFVRELADVYGWTCTMSESATGGARIEFQDVDFVSAG